MSKKIWIAYSYAYASCTSSLRLLWQTRQKNGPSLVWIPSSGYIIPMRLTFTRLFMERLSVLDGWIQEILEWLPDWNVWLGCKPLSGHGDHRHCLGFPKSSTRGCIFRHGWWEFWWASIHPIGIRKGGISAFIYKTLQNRTVSSSLPEAMVFSSVEKRTILPSSKFPFSMRRSSPR